MEASIAVAISGLMERDRSSPEEEETRDMGENCL